MISTSRRPDAHRASTHLHAGGQHRRMPWRQRFWIYSIVGLLWLSGTIWFLLDQFCVQRGEFGATPHPLEAPLLLVHGMVAILSMYLFGWVMARHVSRWWAARRRRLSGGVFTAFLLVLSVSGFALFFIIDDASHHEVVLVHDVLGLAVVVCAVQHWFFRRGRIRSSETRE